MLIGNEMDNIKGYELSGKNYIVHLLNCEKSSNSCIFRINGVNTRRLYSSEVKEDNLAKEFNIDGKYKLKINSVEFDYCGDIVYCNLQYEAFDRVNMIVEDTPCDLKDSDNGINYNVFGKILKNGTSIGVDNCKDGEFGPAMDSANGLWENYVNRNCQQQHKFYICENNYLQVDGSDKTFICPNVCEDGACVESNDNSEIKTRYAYWECSNGVSSKSGGPMSCKPRYIWEEYGNEFCRAQCGDMGCTLKTFKTWEKCGEIIDDILILPAVDLPVYTLPIDMAVDTTIRESEKCNGCFNNEICLPFGTRLLSNDLPSYCSINQKIVNQLGVDEPCMNSYECKTNQCTSNVCIDLKQEIAETKGLLQKILNWLSQLFG